MGGLQIDSLLFLSVTAFFFFKYIYIYIYKMHWQGAQLYGRDLDYNEEEPRQGLYSD